MDGKDTLQNYLAFLGLLHTLSPSDLGLVNTGQFKFILLKCRDIIFEEMVEKSMLHANSRELLDVTVTSMAAITVSIRKGLLGITPFNQRQKGVNVDMFDYRELSRIISKNRNEELLGNKFRSSRRPLAIIQRQRLDTFLEARVKDSPLHYSLAISTLRSGAPYVFSQYHKYFKHEQMVTLHYKELIDITLGYNCHGKEFIRDAIQKPNGKWGMDFLNRHHNDRIKSINTPFLTPYLVPRSLRKYFEPNGLDPKGGWRVMLSPIYRKTHLDAMHALYRSGIGTFDDYTRKNLGGHARETHLYEIVQRAFDPNKPEAEYYTELFLEFRQKEAEIGGRNVKIWEDVDQDSLFEIIDRWIARKKTPNRQVTNSYRLEDDSWYNDPQNGYYKNFYNFMYKDSENYLLKVLQMDLNDPQVIATNRRTKHFVFYRWYATSYLGEDTYPVVYDSNNPQNP